MWDSRRCFRFETEPETLTAGNGEQDQLVPLICVRFPRRRLFLQQPRTLRPWLFSWTLTAISLSHGLPPSGPVARHAFRDGLTCSWYALVRLSRLDTTAFSCS